MVGFLVAALYVSIIGFEMSATRALIAASCVCAGLLMDRAGGFGQRWWVALLLMHVVFPWATYEIGVLLTFAALAGIGVGARLGQGRAFVTWMWVNVSVWVFTSLILIPATGTISLLGLVLNLLIPAPWSVLNCTLGVMGLVGCLLDVPGGATLLNMVFWVNERVAALLIAVRDSIGGSAQCEDDVAGVATVGFVALSIGLVARATRTPPSLRCLVRCGA
jgi:predicted membrane metal-binding protein